MIWVFNLTAWGIYTLVCSPHIDNACDIYLLGPKVFSIHWHTQRVARPGQSYQQIRILWIWTPYQLMLIHCVSYMRFSKRSTLTYQAPALPLPWYYGKRYILCSCTKIMYINVNKKTTGSDFVKTTHNIHTEHHNKIYRTAAVPRSGVRVTYKWWQPLLYTTTHHCCLCFDAVFT